MLIDLQTETVIDVNPFLLELLGLPVEDLANQPVTCAERLLGFYSLRDLLAATRDTAMVRYDDVGLTTPAGRMIRVDVAANRIRAGERDLVHLNFRDNSTWNETAKVLRQSEERFRLFIDGVRDYAMFQMDSHGRILTWSKGAENLLGWTEQEAIGQSAFRVFTPEDRKAGEPEREIETARLKGRAEDERWHVRKDGTRFFASGVLAGLKDEAGNVVGLAKVMRDVTTRQLREDDLKRSAENKSALVREIHHRVKNNLQVIIGLLSLQASHTDMPEVLAAFEDTQGRIRAIAHIHERLYASDDLSQVEFGAYLTSLARELTGLYAATPQAVELDTATVDMVLDIEQAIPLALIANELIVNSFKHGMGGTGRLTIRLHYVEGSFDAAAGEMPDDGWAQMLISDSGPGLPASFEPSTATSMGFRLITMLVRQLHANLEVGPGPGATFRITFPLRVPTSNPRPSVM